MTSCCNENSVDTMIPFDALQKKCDDSYMATIREKDLDQSDAHDDTETDDELQSSTSDAFCFMKSIDTQLFETHSCGDGDDMSDRCRSRCANENNRPLIMKNTQYNSNKPKWWKVLGTRRGSKGQRSAIHRMTSLGYVLPKLDAYDHVLNLTALFKRKQKGGISNDSFSLFNPRHEYSSNASTICMMIVCLEIGCGCGENILMNAKHFPNQFYIGADIFQPGIGTALQRMEHAIHMHKYWEPIPSDHDNGGRHRKNNDYLHPVNDADDTSITNIETKTDTVLYQNIRFYRGDGIKLLHFLPRQSLDHIYITFPDPFPSKKDSHWRIVQIDTIQKMQTVLKPGIGCIFLATDDYRFDEWTRCVFTQVIQQNQDTGDGGTLWQEVIPCPDRKYWLPVISKYENKGRIEGRKALLQCWKFLGSTTQ